MEKNPKKKKFSLKDEFNNFRNLSWKEAKEIGKDTLKDLKSPKEIFALVAAVVLLPGGVIIYPAYRVRKYRVKNKPPANDDGRPPQV